MQRYEWWKNDKNDMWTYDNNHKIAAGQRNDYTTGYLLDDNHCQRYYKLIVIDLSKQQALMLIRKKYNKLILLEVWNEIMVQ